MYAEEQGEAKNEERQWGKQKADSIEPRAHEEVDKTDDKRKAAARSFFCLRLGCILQVSCKVGLSHRGGVREIGQPTG